MDKLYRLIKRFDIRGTVEEITPFGAGLINDTYKVTTACPGADTPATPDYVLQRVNHKIFQDVDLLQANVVRITEHIRHRLEAAGVVARDIDRRVLRVVPTVDGALYYKDGNSYWRVTVLIPGAVTHEQVTPELAGATGRAFGEFQGMLSDLPGEPLGATIPRFHDMEFRLEQLYGAIEADKAKRVKSMSGVIDDLLGRADEMIMPQQMVRSGGLPMRVTHCDTKVNNVLFDARTGGVLCVIDLDTTMPGVVISDFGDFIRTAANTGAEDDPDPTKVGVNMDIFRSFASGYLQTAGWLTGIEIEMLPFGTRWMTFMQTIRFLTDYLDGDKYYKTAYKEHNLVRTMAQLAMLRSLEAHMVEMNGFVAEQANKNKKI